jgi:hypothetical protein
VAYSFKQTYAHEIITALKASGTLYLALFTTAPTATAAGTEVSGGS